MTAGSAFRGDVELKYRAIADLRAGLHPGWSVVATEQDRRNLAEAYGLTQGFLSLVLSARGAPAPTEFIAEALGLVDPGRDLNALIADWIVVVWQHPTLGVSRILAETEAMPACEAVIATVRSSKLRALTRQEWRAVRTGVATAKSLTPVQSRYATVVAAMAWDPVTTAGLAGDVWIAWDQAFQTELLASAGISEVEHDDVLEAVRAGMRRAWETLGAPQADATADEVARSEKAKQAELDQYLSDAGFSARWDKLNAAFENVLRPAYIERQPKALGTVLEVCRQVPA